MHDYESNFKRDKIILAAFGTDIAGAAYLTWAYIKKIMDIKEIQNLINSFQNLVLKR